MAFVHLHNHTVFSMLDGATRIQDMVNRAVELGMPAVAITDHGYMYGVPDLALACDAVNHNTPEYKTWSHDKAFLEKDRRDELVEPDPEENPREHAQYVKDMAMWDEKGNIDELSRLWSSSPSLAARSTLRRTRPLLATISPSSTT